MTAKRTKSKVSQFIEDGDLIFFKPNQKFLDFWKRPEWKWRLFHDCGAGAGRMAHDMTVSGREVKAWDLYPRSGRKSLVKVERFDTSNIADEMDLSEVAILARPCHSDQFIDKTIRSALCIGEAFYVGLEHNLVRDLDQFEYDVVAEGVGDSNELLLRIRCAKNDFSIRRLLKVSGGREEWWWYQPHRKRYSSEPTGLSGFSESDGHALKVLREERWASDLQLMLTKEEVCRDDHKSGWIAPDGEWFGCGYAEHDYVARSVLGCSVRRLEAIGFCRCHGSEGGRMMWTQGDGTGLSTRRPTARQKAELKRRGYDPKF